MSEQSPRIDAITIDGFGPFEDATFEIPPPEGEGELVLFEGPNGSGKTTLLEAIAVTVSGDADGQGLYPPHKLLQRRARTKSAQMLLKLGRVEATYRAGDIFAGWPGAHEDTETILQPGRAARQDTPTTWAIFAFRGAQSTASLETKGPQPVNEPSLRGALSFGDTFPVSAALGQILVNWKYDIFLAIDAAATEADPARREELLRRAADRRDAIHRLGDALSQVLAREVTIDFPLDRQPVEVRFDGELIPLDMLGEGMRRTFAWMSDLLVRLERTPWADKSRSPLHQDSWLLLDEVDQSLHPELQRRILPALRTLFPRARIYVTTHSPIVVASAPDGYVFPIRPDPKTHRVSGPVAAIKLGPGRSLAWAVEEVFGVPSPFVDQQTIDLLEAHRHGVDRLRRGEVEGFDWATFAKLRAPLIAGEGEARAMVALREAPVRRLIDDHLRDLPVAAE